YAEILQCKTILNDVGGIIGTYREPKTKIIFGSNNTETIHKENGIRFKLDPQKIMFSSGNMDERIRMATISDEKETIVDLFAGIGYFTLPLAVHSKPKKIFACEINPVAYDYLCKNIVLNNVSNIVEPLKGDNKEVTPKNIADRVLLGYFGDTNKFLTTALNCLRDCKGIIHYHDKFPESQVPDKPLRLVKELADKYNRKAELIDYKQVKSYAPGISHYVFDIGIDEK
ncbi:MAG: class I SAM-dependent methyltransferase family protein, partial [Thermoplasmatales archaeon]|nr:class I SAM-dependent methyltransferase family protein [Thermoplasmatales archaeon]